jgi:hypothetical protein
MLPIGRTCGQRQTPLKNFSAATLVRCRITLNDVSDPIRIAHITRPSMPMAGTQHVVVDAAA